MIHSMTGYGKSVLQLPTKKITIELKSLNSKNLDLNARMPSIYREKELAIRKLLAKKLVRGKVDFSIYVETTAEDTSTQINAPVVKQYINQLKKLLKPNGVLIIAVPNYKSYDANYYKQFWAAYDVPRHLWHFSQSSIKKLFLKVDMGVSKILPMKFDAFYVSLLSSC